MRRLLALALAACAPSAAAWSYASPTHAQCPLSRRAAALSMVSMPENFRPKMNPYVIPGERRAAVERILEVELSRLQTAFELNWKKL